MYVFIYLLIYLFIYLFISIFIYLFIYLSIYLFIYLLIHPNFRYSLISSFSTLSGEWPPYASYLTLETAKLVRQSQKRGAVPGGIVGELYVRAVYNDKEQVMDGCNGLMWCPYGLFRTQALKWSMTHAEYVKECRNPI